MNLIERIKSWFAPKKTEEPVSEQKQAKITKTCRECGKTFTIDPAWKFVPNYCKACKQRFVKEKEEQQRSGEPRRIKRKCKNCGKYFTFPNTLAHYPSYCNNCRKAHQAQMKAKYGSPVKREKK